MNFGVITQAGAQLKTISSAQRDVADACKHQKTNDGLVEKRSDFLTNCAGSDPPAHGQQSASAFLSTPMEWIDQFSGGEPLSVWYMDRTSNAA